MIGYNRLDYWTKCIEGIKSAIDELDESSRNIKIYGFLDGPPSIEVEKSSEVFKKAFAGLNTQINVQNENLGSDKHIHYALENSLGCSLDKMDTEHLIVEDDVILNRNSLVNMNKMIQRFGSDPSIGSFQLWNENLGAPADGVMPVESTQTHWWGYTLDLTTYRLSLRPTLMEYYEIVKGAPQSQRPNRQIWDWMKPRLNNYAEWLKTYEGDGEIRPNETEFQRIRKSPAMSQDMAMAISLLEARLLKVAPYYAMCSNVGRVGAHMSPAIHERVTAGIVEVKETVKEFTPI